MHTHTHTASKIVVIEYGQNREGQSEIEIKEFVYRGDECCYCLEFECGVYVRECVVREHVCTRCQWQGITNYLIPVLLAVDPAYSTLLFDGLRYKSVSSYGVGAKSCVSEYTT